MSSILKYCNRQIFVYATPAYPHLVYGPAQGTAVSSILNVLSYYRSNLVSSTILHTHSNISFYGDMLFICVRLTYKPFYLDPCEVR